MGSEMCIRDSAWKAVSGVSKFGWYDGGTVNVAIDLDFFPRFFMTKAVTHYNSASWMIWDTARSGASASGDSMLPSLMANTNNAESSLADDIHLYESGSVKGVQLRTTNTSSNAGSARYIYIAFA